MYQLHSEDTFVERIVLLDKPVQLPHLRPPHKQATANAHISIPTHEINQQLHYCTHFVARQMEDIVAFHVHALIAEADARHGRALREFVLQLLTTA
jgi:hypothetical protein